ncbi:TetR/AcrR family transcriptional regulator [Hoeflea ulvae]|uniref:TetR/AcrR family transcriptional regulator n=1 Tax=Hoeflea ulvae TaxID=2983764 RepID=A0ABT3YCH2_9HYPH|nr:TetR/AcrR family transcriptional regulator [Hoeflea ulvae]MCY0093593.1 TetR/AcrR family transcriptional regulator [Hoeflea ulvae]
MDSPTVDIASQRVSDILDKVKSVFALNGFDGASMQDLAQATQMSVGNFYRYFPSKDAIITALVRRDLMEIEAVFDTVRTASDPGAMFMHLLAQRIENMPCEDAALWSEVQAASHRSPDIATLVRGMDETVRSNIVDALVRIHGDDSSRARAEFETRAHLVMLVVHGFAQRKFCAREAMTPEKSAALAELALATLRQTLFASPAQATE